MGSSDQVRDRFEKWDDFMAFNGEINEVVESRYDIKKIGDYDYWNENGGPKEFKKDFQLNNNQRILFELEADRNKIAHGGGMDATTAPPREYAGISKEKLAKYRAGVAALFKAFPVGVE